MKKCSICKIEKDSSCFHLSRSKKDGLNGYCKECSYLKSQKYKTTLAGKEYRKRNKETPHPAVFAARRCLTNIGKPNESSQ